MFFFHLTLVENVYAMDAEKFYNTVSGWIDSYNSQEALNGLRQFIDNSKQPLELKNRLHALIDAKRKELTDVSYFCIHGAPALYTSLTKTIAQVNELRAAGHNPEIVIGNPFYKIRLNTAV